MKKYLGLGISVLLLAVTVSAQTGKEERKRLKKERAELEYQQSKDLVSSGEYAFVALLATPLGGGRFLINSIPNYIQINGEETVIYMPYFGVAVMAHIGSKEAGIKFRGAMENYTVEYNDAKQRIVVFFEVQNGTERFAFTFNIYKAGAASVSVVSNGRNNMSYTGSISPLEDLFAN